MSTPSFIRVSAVIVSAAFAALVAPLLHATPINISFTADTATASGVTAGGDVVWIMRSLDEFSGSPLLGHRLEVTRDHDGNGAVEVRARVKQSSVWVAVDLTTGNYGVAKASGTAPRPLQPRSDGSLAGLAYLDFAVSEVHVLLVRPGVGAWARLFVQGSATDGDGRSDGNLRVSLSLLDVLHGGVPVPIVTQSRDVWVAIIPDDLSTYVVAVGGSVVATSSIPALSSIAMIALAAVLGIIGALSMR